MKQTDTYTPEAIGLMLKAVQAETGFKGKQLFMAIRIALTGHMHGRDLNRTLYLLGKDKVLSRLQSLNNNNIIDKKATYMSMLR